MNKLFLGMFLLGITGFESALFNSDELRELDNRTISEKYNNINVENVVNNIFKQESNKETLNDIFKAIKTAMWKDCTTVITLSMNKLNAQFDWVKVLQSNIKNILSQNEGFSMDLKQKIFDFDDIGFSYTTRGEKPFIIRLYKDNSCCSPISFSIDYENDFSVKSIDVPVIKKDCYGEDCVYRYTKIKF